MTERQQLSYLLSLTSEENQDIQESSRKKVKLSVEEIFDSPDSITDDDILLSSAPSSSLATPTPTYADQIVGFANL